jgi:predicted Zn-dependent peptidase
MIKAFILCALLLAGNGYAQSREEIGQMLSHFEKSGLFSSEEVKQAQQFLSNLSDEEMDSLKEKAGTMMDDPEIHKKLQGLKD